MGALRRWRERAGRWIGAAFGPLRRRPALPAARRVPTVAARPVAVGRPRASDIFTPTRPRTARRRLVGRTPELARILDALRDEGAHVVLYSERGRGKTSLANIVVTKLRGSGVIVARHACEANSHFDTIIRSLAADLPVSLAGGGEGEGCAHALPGADLRPQDVAEFALRLACPKLVLLVDEFDRVQDVSTRTKLADTIKLLSDRGIGAQFMVVGVAATLEHIIGQHPSIQRNIVAVHLPLLDDAEITAMLVEGGREIGLNFTTDVIAFVLGLARGMPYMAQLLGLRLVQSALTRDSAEVDGEDLAIAVERLIEDARSGIALRYAELTSGARDRDMMTALRVIAMAPQDRYGCLAVAREGGTVKIDGHRVSAEALERLRKTGVLLPASDPMLLRIGDRPLMYHVLLLALHRRLAPQAELGDVGAAAD